MLLHMHSSESCAIMSAVLGELGALILAAGCGLVLRHSMHVHLACHSSCWAVDRLLPVPLKSMLIIA